MTSPTDFRDLRGSNFSNTDLSGCDFHEADLRPLADSSPFASADSLIRTVFVDSNLDGANFTDSIASRCVFISTSARHTNFSGAQLMLADFTDADCTGADFRGAVLDGTVFAGAVLDDALFDPGVFDTLNRKEVSA